MITAKPIRCISVVLIIITISLALIAGPAVSAYAADIPSSSKEKKEKENDQGGGSSERSNAEQSGGNTGSNTNNQDQGNASGSDKNGGTEDIIEENAAATHGNASGDAVKTSGQMDFYTIRTANNQTYYLVIDHSGAMDNVYLLSTIDENDLENFVDSGAARNGGLVVLPDSKSDDESQKKQEDPEASETEKNETKEKSVAKGKNTADKTTIIASIAVIAGAAIAGLIAQIKKLKRSKSDRGYERENLEYDDGLQAAGDDDDL